MLTQSWWSISNIFRCTQMWIIFHTRLENLCSHFLYQVNNKLTIKHSGLFLYLYCILTLFKMGFFGAAHGWERRTSLPQIYPAYPTMMKLSKVVPYLKKIQKKNKSQVTHCLNSPDISIFLPKISKLCCVKKYRYRLPFDT